MCLPSGQLDLLCATYFLTDATTSRRSTAASEMRCDASGEITISRNQLRGTATTQGTRVLESTTVFFHCDSSNISNQH